MSQPDVNSRSVTMTSRDVPRRLKLALRGCVDSRPPSVFGNSADLDGDFILDLLLQDDRTCIWEVAFPPIVGFYRAVVRCQLTEHGLSWSAGLDGVMAGPKWHAFVAGGVPVQLALVVNDLSSVNSDCNITWPASVDLVALANASARTTAGEQQAETIRQLLAADFGPGSVEPPVGATPVTPQQTPTGEGGVDLQDSMPLIVVEVSADRDAGNYKNLQAGPQTRSPERLTPTGTGGATAIGQAGMLMGFLGGGTSPGYLSGIGVIGFSAIYPGLVSLNPLFPTHVLSGGGGVALNELNGIAADDSNCGANPDPNFIVDPVIKATWTPAPDQFCNGKIWVFGRYKNDLVYVQAFAERMGWEVIRNPDGCSWWFKSKATGEPVPVPCCCCG